MSDEDAMQAHLDARPDDWECRRMLGDLLEDAGRRSEGQVQRWMACERRRPGRRGGLWLWWSSAWRTKRGGLVGPKVATLAPGTFWRLEHPKGYATRREAEADLMQALPLLDRFQFAFPGAKTVLKRPKRKAARRRSLDGAGGSAYPSPR